MSESGFAYDLIGSTFGGGVLRRPAWDVLRVPVGRFASTEGGRR